MADGSSDARAFMTLKILKSSAYSKNCEDVGEDMDH